MLIAKIYVRLKKDVYDPQGMAVKSALESLAFKGITSVHVGKYFVIELTDMEHPAAEALVSSMCKKLLSNPVIEDFTFTIESANSSGNGGEM
jgi:phosphoribosylformylglycinamidine synthase